MSDEGKVLRSTNGSFLRSPDGKIVLADDLYPMVPTQQGAGYNRGAGYYPYQEGCASSDVWSVGWSSDGEYPNRYPAQFFNRPSTGSRGSYQTIRQTKFVDNTIDWSRVEKCTQLIYIWAYSWQGTVTARITTSKNNSTLPTGTTIRDTWTTARTFTANESQPSAYNILLEWSIDGVEPTSLEYAAMFDPDTCPTGTQTGVFDNQQNYPKPVRVVYNLAS
jgi:hypothetical protein